MSQTPEAAEDEFQATKASRRNERKKEQRREKAEAEVASSVQEENPSVEVQPVEARAKVAAEKKAAQPPKAKESGGEAKEGGARQRAIEKKLRQIEDLEAKQAQGATLLEEQIIKVSAKKELQAELKSILSGAPMEEVAPKPAVAVAVVEPVVAAAAPEVVAAVEEVAAEPPKFEAPKSKKAIEKKLRQIAEIEEKQSNGEELNPEQVTKLETKKELQQALKTAV